MKNKKSTMNKTIKCAGVIAAGLALSLLTACGGSSSKGKKVTTLPNCPATSFYYNNTTSTYHNSPTDSTKCSLKPVTCTASQVKVRMPLVHSNTNTNTYATQGINPIATNTLNHNFHATTGQYYEKCVSQNDQNWNYIYYGAHYGYSYNWVNISAVSNAWHGSVQYYGSTNAAISSGDIPGWLIGAGVGAVVGNSVDGNDGIIPGGIIGGIIGHIIDSN